MKPELYVVEADRPQWFARLRFLYFIQKLSPETWATLREDVLPLYKRYVSDANASPYVFSEDGKTVMVTERTVRYAKAMRDWERRWNLHDSWLRDESRMALHLWATAGGHEWAPGLMSVLLSNLDAKRAEDASVEALGIQGPHPCFRTLEPDHRALVRVRKADSTSGAEGSRTLPSGNRGTDESGELAPEAPPRRS